MAIRVSDRHPVRAEADEAMDRRNAGLDRNRMSFLAAERPEDGARRARLGSTFRHMLRVIWEDRTA